MVMHPHDAGPGDLVKGRAALHQAPAHPAAPLVRLDDGRIGIPAMSMVRSVLGHGVNTLRTRAARTHTSARRAVASLDGITEAHLESLPKRW